jgi:hypothetical protein
MNYKKIYDDLIYRAQNRVTNGQTYYERHHIIPKCMNGTNDLDNIVYLLPEEHYVAHQLLVKIYPEIPELAFAANMMCTNRPNNKLYGWIRRRISVNMKNNNPNAGGHSRKEYIRKNGPVKVDRSYITIEYKTKCSESKKGSKNPMYNKKPWEHPKATDQTKQMWANAEKYYHWWLQSGLEHGQNAMAKAFNEKYRGTHQNMIKYFKNGWVPTNDKEWKLFSCKI